MIRDLGHLILGVGVSCVLALAIFTVSGLMGASDVASQAVAFAAFGWMFGAVMNRWRA